jgi:RNA polymerase sigma-70 factor (ECF subfamily)
MTGSSTQAAEMTDEQLVRAALAGDHAAFGSLVERHWNMAVALAVTRGADPAEAEDVAQESFVKAYTYLRNLREPARFAGWLGKIVVQQCAAAARKRLRRQAALGDTRVALEALEAMPAPSANPGLTERQINFVQEALRKLPEQFQKLIVMRFVAGLSAVEIAAQLGQRSGTVRVGLHRAYNLLRRDLAALFKEIKT